MKVIMRLFFLVSLLGLTQANSKITLLERARSLLDQTDRIIDGWPAVDGQFPHHAMLVAFTDSGLGQACGGSLISTRWIVTAAHCVYGFSFATCSLGSIDFESFPVNFLTQELHHHPNYNQVNLNHDIGLVGLPEDVPLGNTVSLIKIPNVLSETYEGKIAQFCGFGLTDDGGPMPTTLQYANLTVISNSDCESHFGDEIVINSTVCGSGIESPQQGGCRGDSGGALVVNDGITPLLVGVGSFVSEEGCLSHRPTGFLRPYHYLEWIKLISGVDFS